MIALLPGRQPDLHLRPRSGPDAGWNGSICTAASWEITEPDVGYQGALVMLVAFAM